MMPTRKEIWFWSWGPIGTINVTWPKTLIPMALPPQLRGRAQSSMMGPIIGSCVHSSLLRKWSEIINSASFSRCFAAPSYNSTPWDIQPAFSRWQNKVRWGRQWFLSPVLKYQFLQKRTVPVWVPIVGIFATIPKPTAPASKAELPTQALLASGVCAGPGPSSTRAPHPNSNQQIVFNILFSGYLQFNIFSLGSRAPVRP